MKKALKMRKKVLTKGRWSGILAKRSTRGALRKRGRSGNIRGSRKKVLTNLRACGKISKFARAAWMRVLGLERKKSSRKKKKGLDKRKTVC